MEHKQNFIIVHKDNKNRSIETYASLHDIGARMSIKDFLSLVNDIYGQPTTTMTRAQHLQRLLDSAEKAIYQMKSQTREIAAINMEPPIKRER